MNDAEKNCVAVITATPQCKVNPSPNGKIRGGCIFGMEDKAEWQCCLNGQDHKNMGKNETMPSPTPDETACATAIGTHAECKVTPGSDGKTIGGCRYCKDKQEWHCCLAGECPLPHKGDKSKGESGSKEE
jgi:hypothetical protein